MTNYIYSAKNNAFYPKVLRSDYQIAGTWPDDGIEVTEAVFLEFSSLTPVGKIREAGFDKMPHWVDIPSSTRGELSASAVEENRG